MVKKKTASPDFSKPFSVVVDASDPSAGAALLQVDYVKDIENPTAVFSKKFNKHKNKYSTIEKEPLALV